MAKRHEPPGDGKAIGSRARALRARFAALATGTILLGALAVGGMASPASAATIIDGCTIVANPTSATHANCTSRNLSNADLSGLNLAYANLSGSNLTKANLTGSNLSSANLTPANLSGANLLGANLSGANLSGSNLSGANLSGANLHGANLSGSNLSGANLSGANLSGANLSGSNLSGANLSGANLSGANLTGSNLSKAHLGEANLSGANVSGANLNAFFAATVMPNGTVNSSGSTITVSPGTASVPNGLTQAFAATAHYSDGTTIALSNNVSWSSSNAQVATVSPTGVATGVVPDPSHSATFPQAATIRATAGTVYGSGQLTVVAPNLVSLAVAPTSAAVVVGSTQVFTATGTYTDNATRVLTSATWSSTKTSVATISSTGVATGVGPGSAAIQASSGSTSGSATLTTVPVLGVTTASPLPDAVQGASGYSQRLASTGGTGAATWTLAPGSNPPPPGLSLAPDGTVSGTPTQAGSYSFTVQATDPGPPPQVATEVVAINVVTQIAITTASLPGGVAGARGYSQTLAAAGGTSPYTWGLAPGSTLPLGLSLAPDGTVSGALPASPGTVSFTVQATDHGSPAQQVTKTVTIPVASQLTVVSIASLVNGVVGQPFSQALGNSASGGTAPYAFTLAPGSNPLPPGLQLGPDGTLSGNPSQAGSYTFSIQATDAGNPSQSAAASVSLTVVAALSATPATSLTTIGVVGQPFDQSLVGTASGGVAPYSWAVATGSTLPPGINLSGDGTLTGTPTAAGSYTFTVQVTDHTNPSQSATTTVTLTVGPALTVTTTSLPDAVGGIAYSQTLSAANGSGILLNWSIVSGSLPDGLTLSPSGVISGSPTATVDTSSSFTVQVTDDSNPPQTATQALSINVDVPLVVSTSSLPDAQAGSAYDATLTTAGTPGPSAPEWFVLGDTLPPGLSLDTFTGAISGTPTTPNYPGTYNFTVQVLEGSAAATKDLSIKVAPLPLTVSYPACVRGSDPGACVNFPPLQQQLPTWDATKPYNQSLSAAGGFLPYTWTITSGDLPVPFCTQDRTDQTAFNGPPACTAGQIGTTILGSDQIYLPPPDGTYVFTAQVTDGSGTTASESLRLQVVNSNTGTETPPPSITTTSLPDDTLGSAYSATLAATGGSGGYFFTIVGGSLPGGLNLSTNGIISGASTAPAVVPGIYNFTVQVEDSFFITATKQLTISVPDPNNPGGTLNCIAGC